MKNFFLLIFFLFPSFVFAQFGVSFHQSNLPFIGINYEIKERFRPAFRFGTDNFLDEISLEVVVTYDILEKDRYELYAGIGTRTDDFSGILVPIGINIYPFDFKNFGFHIEVAPIFRESIVLRGSWGIRYRFKKEE